MKKIAIMGAMLAVLLVSGCDRKPEAPFGLKWGQTVKQTLAQNLKNAKLTGDDSILAFIHADSVPEPVQYKGRYYLTFSPELGLTSVTFSTKVDEESIYFNQGRTIYSQISKRLEEKYGPPQKINENVERDGAEFYTCIREDGCGKWERTYLNKGMNVKLSVEPTPGDIMDGFAKGYVEVRYEYLTNEMQEKMFDRMKKKENSNNF